MSRAKYIGMEVHQATILVAVMKSTSKLYATSAEVGQQPSPSRAF